MEIERKFLVNQLPSSLNEYKKKEISQGYISLSNPTIRVRQMDNKYYLTVKSNSNISEEDKSISTNEYEVEISADKFKFLSAKVDTNFLKKTRYYIPLNNYMAELDIYYEDLNGLFTVEVEFPTIEQAKSFIPPAWFGQDVSSDIRYKNFHLSTNGIPK